jgi:hypothetical protein
MIFGELALLSRFGRPLIGELPLMSRYCRLFFCKPPLIPGVKPGADCRHQRHHSRSERDLCAPDQTPRKPFALGSLTSQRSLRLALLSLPRCLGLGALGAFTFGLGACLGLLCR